MVVLNYYYERSFESEKALLKQYFIQTEWAESLADLGAQVTVFQRYHRDSVCEQNGVRYRFISDRHSPRLRTWQIPLKLHRRIRRFCHDNREAGIPTVIHFHGLIFPLQAYLLKLMLPKNCPLAAQHHAEIPWRGRKRSIQRWGLKGVDGFLFASQELSASWIENGIIRSIDDVYEVMEVSTTFLHENRGDARMKTSMRGNPVILWTGNLNHNKDPLTILEGFERIVRKAPEARLYMGYRYADLLPEVRKRISGSAALSRSVILLGEIPHSEIAAYYNSADIFVQGSEKEGSGIALLEAMACGIVPVVTDIPAFRTITGHGKVGMLWPRGDAGVFAKAVLSVLEYPIEVHSEAVRDLFERTWCYPVVARRALMVYGELLRRFDAQPDHP